MCKLKLIAICVLGLTGVPFLKADAQSAGNKIASSKEDIATASASIAVGDKAYKDKRYAVAADEYKLALDSVPETPATHSLRLHALGGFSEASVRLGEQCIAEGRYEEARTAEMAVLGYDPNYKPAIELLAHLEDPHYFNPRPGPGSGPPREIKELFAEARAFYDAELFESAYKRYDQILDLDPYNVAARKGEEDALAAIKKYENMGGHTVALKNAVPANTSTGTEYIQNELNRAGIEYIQNKLNRIVIPQLKLTDAKVVDVIGFFHQKSVELDTAESDPARKGVNFFLKSNSMTSENGVPVLPDVPLLKTPDSPAPAISPGDEKITLSLTNVHLSDALRYVTELAGLKFKVEAEEVDIEMRSQPPKPTGDADKK